MSGMVGFTEVADNERPKTWKDIEDPGDGAPYFLDRAGRTRDVLNQLRRAVRWHLADLMFKGPGTNLELVRIAGLVITAEAFRNPARAIVFLDQNTATEDESEAVRVAVARISDSFELAAFALTSIR